EQRRVDGGIDVADLVEKKGPPVRDLEQSLFRRHRSGKSAALVAEQLGLEELRAETGAVQVYERFLRARSLPVEPRREHALSRTGRPTDENGAARRQHDARLPGQLSDGRARSQEWIGRAPPARGAPRSLPAARP